MRPVYTLVAFLGASAYAAPVQERTSIYNGGNDTPDASKNLLDYLGGLGDFVQRINKALPLSIDIDLPILPDKRGDSDNWKYSDDAVNDYINRLDDYIRKIVASLPSAGVYVDLDVLGLTKRNWGQNENSNGGNNQGGNNQGGNDQVNNNSNPWQNPNWGDFDLNGLRGNLRDLLKRIGVNVIGPVPAGDGGLSVDLGGLIIE